jgi:hypothetical protein
MTQAGLSKAEPGALNGIGTAAGLILAVLTIRYQRDRWRKAPRGS